MIFVAMSIVLISKVMKSVSLLDLNSGNPNKSKQQLSHIQTITDESL